MSSPSQPSGSRRRARLGLRVLLEGGRRHDVVGQPTRRASGFSSRAPRPSCRRSARRRPAAEVLEHAELVLHLRAAGDEDEGPLDLAEQLAELLQLALEQEARVGRQQVGDALGRRVGAVGRAERVVDERSQPSASSRANFWSFASRPDRSACSRAPGRARRRAARGGARPTGRIEKAGSGALRTPEVRADRTSAASCSSSSSRVGSAARIRVSSATRPSSSGTLRSARTSTRLPATSASRTERGPPHSYAPTAPAGTRCATTLDEDRRAGSCSPTRCRTSRAP